MHSSRLRLCGSRENTFCKEYQECLRYGRVLQLSQELDERLPKRWHDIGGVVCGQATNEGHGSYSILEDLVVYSNEQRAQVLGLGEMLIEVFMQRRQYGLSDAGVCVMVSTTTLRIRCVLTYQNLQWKQ